MSSEERFYRKSLTATTAERLQRLAEDPAVSGFFDDLESELVTAMIDAEPSDEDGRSDAALKVRCLRQLRFFLSGEIARGKSAAAEIEKIKRTPKNVT